MRLRHLCTLVAAAALLACAVAVASPSSARAEEGVFCYKIALGARGSSNDHCYSNWDYVQTAIAWSYAAHDWAWVYNQTYGSTSEACYEAGCEATAELVGPGHGYEENANLSGFSETFFGSWYSYAI
jgi:hypothetical protein